MTRPPLASTLRCALVTAWLLGCGSNTPNVDSQTVAEPSALDVSPPTGVLYTYLVDHAGPDAYQAAKEATSVDTVLKMYGAGALSCLEMFAIRPSVRAQALQRLGDESQVHRWRRFAGLLSLSVSRHDAVGLIAFVRRGHSGPVHLDGRDTSSTPNRVQHAITVALNSLGRMAANIDLEEGDPSHNPAADFLLDCASPNFWRAPNVQFPEPPDWQKVRFSLVCIVSLAFSDSHTTATRLQIRIAELKVAGEWLPRLDDAYREYERIRSEVVKDGGVRPHLLRTCAKCSPRTE